MHVPDGHITNKVWENEALWERQVERRFVSGLRWPHISPLQMNINKELLISAACTVCEYVCMQGRHGGAVWTSLPPPLASPPSSPLPQNLYLYHFLLISPPPHAHFFHKFFFFLIFFIFLSLSFASPPHSFFLSITAPYVSSRDADVDAGTGFVIHQNSDLIYGYLSAIWYISSVKII